MLCAECPAELSERNFFVGSLGKRAPETLVGVALAVPARAEGLNHQFI